MQNVPVRKASAITQGSHPPPPPIAILHDRSWAKGIPSDLEGMSMQENNVLKHPCSVEICNVLLHTDTKKKIYPITLHVSHICKLQANRCYVRNVLLLSEGRNTQGSAKLACVQVSHAVIKR